MEPFYLHLGRTIFNSKKLIENQKNLKFYPEIFIFKAFCEGKAAINFWKSIVYHLKPNDR